MMSKKTSLEEIGLKAGKKSKQDRDGLNQKLIVLKTDKIPNTRNDRLTNNNTPNTFT